MGELARITYHKINKYLTFECQHTKSRQKKRKEEKGRVLCVCVCLLNRTSLAAATNQPSLMCCI